MTIASAITLYGFQQRWLADKSRFKIGNMCRQIGKSFIVALEVVDDAMETGDDWVLLSAGERQSKELMSKVKMHCQAFAAAAADIEESCFDGGGVKYTMLTVTLPNGARIIGLPANPDTARGFTANVVLDEFAFHTDSNKIWTALYPTISRGYKIRIVSTQAGVGNRFHTLMTGDNGWSKHTVDIYQAAADGVPHNIVELRKGIDDPDAWAQEYECRFVDESSSWLTYEMIAACQQEGLPKELEYSDLTDAMVEQISRSFSGDGQAFGGFDVSRRRDLTVLDIEEQIGDVFWQRAMIIFPHVRLTVQQEMLWRLMDQLHLERVCLDATGMGLSLAEDTVARYGAYLAEPVEFTLSVKQDLAARTRRLFEDRLCRIPICQKLRDDLHAVKKTTTAAGHVRFDAQRTDLGHADRFWAKSLAFMASNLGATVKPELICLSDAI
jgi:phage FluMu gp28-like protein